MTLKAINSTDFHRNIGNCIQRVAVGKETLAIERHGYREVVLIPAEEYEALMEARRQLAWARLSLMTKEEPDKTPV